MKSIFFCITYLFFCGSAYSKFIIKPENNAQVSDSIIIYVPIFDRNKFQIVHKLTKDEKNDLNESKEIDIVNIFSSSDNDTLPPLETNNDNNYEGWGKIEIGKLKAGIYEIYWEGRSVMSYEVLENNITAINQISGIKKNEYHFKNELYRLNGVRIRVSAKFKNNRITNR